jgi:hypothetical protein
MIGDLSPQINVLLVSNKQARDEATIICNNALNEMHQPLHGLVDAAHAIEVSTTTWAGHRFSFLGSDKVLTFNHDVGKFVCRVFEARFELGDEAEVFGLYLHLHMGDTTVVPVLTGAAGVQDAPTWPLSDQNYADIGSRFMKWLSAMHVCPAPVATPANAKGHSSRVSYPAGGGSWMSR